MVNFGEWSLWYSFGGTFIKICNNLLQIELEKLKKTWFEHENKPRFCGNKPCFCGNKLWVCGNKPCFFGNKPCFLGNKPYFLGIHKTVRFLKCLELFATLVAKDPFLFWDIVWFLSLNWSNSFYAYYTYCIDLCMLTCHNISNLWHFCRSLYTLGKPSLWYYKIQPEVWLLLE